MKTRFFAKHFQYSMIALALMNLCAARALAQQSHAHASKTQDQQSKFLKIVRDSTERFKDVSVAVKAGYTLQFGCVTGGDSGAMGMHYVNLDLVNSGVIDTARPQIVIYEPTANGGLKLIGADYLVLADTWNKQHPDRTPQLGGQLFHLFESPNRFGLPAFYTLHVWAWKDNPNGAFVNWHPNVSCAPFSGEAP
jgi:hypothetical protein